MQDLSGVVDLYTIICAFGCFLIINLHEKVEEFQTKPNLDLSDTSDTSLELTCSVGQ
jgi:hypothetical protein